MLIPLGIETANLSPFCSLRPFENRICRGGHREVKVVTAANALAQKLRSRFAHPGGRDLREEIETTQVG